MLEFTVDSLDTVPEAQRGLYKATGDKFTLDVSGLEDTAGLKSALQKERDAAKAATKQANAWAALGKTPDEISALVDAQKQADTDHATKNGEWDKLRTKMIDAHNAETSKQAEAMSHKDKALSRYLIDAAAVTALAAAKGSTALLLPHIRSAVSVVEDNGDYSVRVLDAAGTPRVNGKGEFLTIGDLVSEMRQSNEYNRAFDADTTAGGGAASSKAITQPTAQLTSVQKIAAGLKAKT